MQFIQVELNNKARVKDNKRLVKAQAAASGHAKARQKRVQQHQRQRAAQAAACAEGHPHQAGAPCVHNKSAAKELDVSGKHAAMLVFAAASWEQADEEGACYFRPLARSARVLSPEVTAKLCPTCAAGTASIPAEAVSYATLDLEDHVPEPREMMSGVTRDPFRSTARDLSDHEWFLLQQWRTTILPALIESQRFQNPRHCQKFYHDQWLPLALTDVGMLSGLLLCSAGFTWSTEADPVKARFWQKLTAKLKLDLITSLNKDIRESSEGHPVTDAAICKTMMLAAEAMGMGEVGACAHHAQGLLAMINQRGGFETLSRSTNFFRAMLLIHLLPDHSFLWPDAIPFCRKDPVWLPQHRGCHRPLKKLHLAYSMWLKQVGFDERSVFKENPVEGFLEGSAMANFLENRKSWHAD